MNEQLRQRLIVGAITAILETLAELPQGGPESAHYLALGSDLELWYEIKAIMIECDYITETSNWIKPTPKGLHLGQESLNIKAQGVTHE
jgi:hypothetical protein